MEAVKIMWIIIQVLVGYNLIFPALLYCLHPFLYTKKYKSNEHAINPDYAFIVTAYQFTDALPAVISSILNVDYDNYLIYVVADNCNTDDLHFENQKVVLLRPPSTLASNTKSHDYAIKSFVRAHDRLTIIDSDNIVNSNYLKKLNEVFNRGFNAVQGLRAAKNLDGTIACLDAARDIYYHFYDGKLLFECGSSATLSGSGMAFSTELYRDFLAQNNVTGAGFDKVLQAWLVRGNNTIAFSENAIIFDEKTSRPDQLVKQRSRWINTWFKYFMLGFQLLWLGIKNFSRNQFLFGIVLLRPPLFIFLVLSASFLLINTFAGLYIAASIWLAGLIIFVLFFLIALKSSQTDKRIYRSLINIPQFIFYQILSLIKANKANKISVATKHYYTTESKDQ